MALRHDAEKLDFVTESDTRACSDYDRSYPEHHENPSPEGYDAIIDRFTAQEAKRIIRRIDLRLIPLCGLMYCVSLLDRTNLSNAAIAG